MLIFGCFLGLDTQFGYRIVCCMVLCVYFSASFNCCTRIKIYTIIITDSRLYSAFSLPLFALVNPPPPKSGCLVLMSLLSLLLSLPSVTFGPAAGMAIKRERCDSLPSRNRTISDSGNASSLTSNPSTIMPPPKTIPSWNRPVSMCNRPSNSPISPSILSESEGSSISIDEPDSMPVQYTNSSTPDDNGGYFHRYAG